MWWNDIKDIKDWIIGLTNRLVRLEHNIEILLGHAQEKEDCLNKLNSLVEDAEREKSAVSAIKIMDKFEDYMKNVDKLNDLINEVKGCAVLARGAISERKELDKVSKIADDIYKAMNCFIEAGNKMESKKFFKIDQIHRAICEEGTLKTKPKRKYIKKKKVTPSP